MPQLRTCRILPSPLAGFKVLRKFMVLQDLPKTALGKVRKTELVERYENDRGRDSNQTRQILS